MPTTERSAIHSSQYVEAGKTNVFEALPAVPNRVDETFEDKVVLDIEGEKFEILPVSHKRVKVLHHHEERQSAPTRDWEYLNGTRAESHCTSEGDKELIAKANRILGRERVTYDAALWDILERLRAPRQEIKVILPAGYTFSRHDQRTIEKLIQELARGRTKKALHYFSKAQDAKIDQAKVVDEHPGLIERFKEWLDGPRN